mmetsp:Transcript_18949/g.48187  ORF Transcript_18949/g.48187 Transcript_18949/m.48187 type:complete len:202 (+) Transcript_18949:74-679(+)
MAYCLRGRGKRVLPFVLKCLHFNCPGASSRRASLHHRFRSSSDGGRSGGSQDARKQAGLGVVGQPEQPDSRHHRTRSRASSIAGRGTRQPCRRGPGVGRDRRNSLQPSSALVAQQRSTEAPLCRARIAQQWQQRRLGDPTSQERTCPEGAGGVLLGRTALSPTNASGPRFASIIHRRSISPTRRTSTASTTTTSSSGTSAA